MTANTSATFTLTPNITVGQTIATANTAKDGTGTVVTIFTAGANGAMVYAVSAQGLGSNTASVLRIFINNGSTPTSAANNSFYKDITLPATTLSEVATTPAVLLPLSPSPFQPGLTLPAGYRLLATIGTTVAAGYAIQAIGEDY